MKNKTFILVITSVFGIALFLLYCLYHPGKTSSSTKNVYDKIKASEPVSYLVIGDSIGRGSGASKDQTKWFYLLEDKLYDNYGSPLKRNMIVQSGATAFEGLYKFKNSSIQNIDLIFIVFGENDRKYMNNDVFYYLYSQLLLQVKEKYPAAEIITLTESSLDNENFADVISKVSGEYQATNLDMRIPFRESGKRAEELTKDLVHPNDKGYQLYAEYIYKHFNKQIQNKEKSTELPLNDYAAKAINMVTNNDYTFKDSSYVKKQGYYTTDDKGAELGFTFKGTYLGANVIRGPLGGLVDVYIDDEFVTSISTWWPFEKPRSEFIAGGLPDETHKVIFRSAGKASSHNTSGYHRVQISSVIVQDK
ncbi:SGNH/GDSL hydrolase family protein [Niallia sp. MER 6]|uniref:SGNH/GDSL hydrolase family protein n=1 Tax=Niallia sp. MER 6 TaxID=2939567 RepID=UPI00203CF570|nr:SGNH/GDSL hydrolase family protein [Niallia sp. MER 6]MCM3030603.1 GDSL-type esterase/lipase family protein [Niallia sp. MER 6]